MVRQLKRIGDPILRTKAHKVRNLRSRRDINPLVRDMIETMVTLGGVGLAAPQVGVSLRVIVIGNRNTLIMVNPEITYREGEQIGIESCLSIPGYADEIKRPYLVKMKFETERGVSRTAVLTGDVARVACHEVDHLNGILFIDHIDVERYEARGAEVLSGPETVGAEVMSDTQEAVSVPS